MNIFRRTLFLVLVLFITPAAVDSHEGVIPVIVDTDMALDDIRALTLLLQNPQFDLLAVVTSDGSASVDVGARNAARVLHLLHRPEVIIGAGPRLDREPPLWRDHSEALGWADLPPVDSYEVGDASSILSRVLQNAEQRVTYICLGPLTNLAAARQGATFLEHGSRHCCRAAGFSRWNSNLFDLPERAPATMLRPCALRVNPGHFLACGASY